jgi:23S rRNA (pseudouridine1915-N3)-methyltransferase
MGFLFLFAGKTKEGFIREGLDRYAKLAGHYVPVEVRELKGAPGTDRADAVEKEADGIIKRLSPSDRVVVLDEHGKNPDSVSFAKKVGSLAETGGRVVFVAGGPFGISDRLRERADTLLSLSKMTFTHEMARLVLLEQVYRAFTIIKGKTYHY